MKESFELLWAYQDAAVTHGEATKEGDYKVANKAYEQLSKLLKRIAGTCDELLFDLYDHKDLSVQIWAATHTLEIDTNRAVAKLQKVQANASSFYSMSAKYTLLEWENGNLKFRTQKTTML